MTFLQNDTPSTKREVLRSLAKLYDQLGGATPLTLQGKLIYREICDPKLPLDTELTRQLAEKVKNWKQTPPTSVMVPQAVIENREPILDLELHAFGDASTQGLGTSVYAMVWQPSGIT